MLYINSFCIMYSVCICSWWWDVHTQSYCHTSDDTCIYFISSVVFADFLIKSSFKKKQTFKQACSVQAATITDTKIITVTELTVFVFCQSFVNHINNNYQNSQQQEASLFKNIVVINHSCLKKLIKK